MKEKLKNLYNNKTTKILIKILIGLFIINESYNIYLDIYNFRQLEKAKIILNNLKKEEYKFYTLEKFNEKYNAGIKTIKNCYEISNNNGKYPYIFGFKLESKFFNLLYSKGYYVYPGYDIEIIPLCSGLGNGECIKDRFYHDFIKTISNPCQD